MNREKLIELRWLLSKWIEQEKLKGDPIRMEMLKDEVAHIDYEIGLIEAKIEQKMNKIRDE